MSKSDPKTKAEQAKAELELKELELKVAQTAKAHRELEEAESPQAKAMREAETQKAIDEAQQQSAEAQQKQWSALVPDLTKVTPGSLEDKKEEPLFGPSLAQRATAAAAKEVAAQVSERIDRDLASAQILITGDVELASSDAIYVEVLGGLQDLVTAAEKLMKDIDPDHAPLVKAPTQTPADAKTLVPVVGAAALPVAKALASALPGVLSVFSAHRTLSTGTVTVDSFAAATVVAGVLSAHCKEPGVFHDDFRLLPTKGRVRDAVSTLAKKREELVALKLKLEDRSSAESAHVAQLKSAVKESEEELKSADKSERDALRAKLDGQQKELVAPEVAVAECTSRISLIGDATGVIDNSMTSMKTIADGAAHSPLTAAILREQLHGGDDSRDGEQKPWFTHVLLVKAEPGSAEQLTDDRPLMFKDKFSTIATSSVTYMVIETGGSSVVAAGSVGGKAKINGSIGKEFSVEEEAISVTK